MRVLIVGAGGIAHRHIDRLARIEGIELVAVCDINKERARALAEKWLGAVAVLRDVKQAIRDTHPDYLLLSTPRTVRLPVLETCVEVGCPVLMEKPPCHDMETGRRIESLLGNASLLHSVGFQHRYHDALHHAWSTLGGASSLRMIDIRYSSSMATRFREQPKLAPYLLAQSGGLIGDQGIHYVDLARYLTGSEPAAMSGETSQQCLPDEPGLSPDTAGWTLRMESGCLVTQAHTWCSDRWRCLVTLTGEAGCVTVDMFANRAEGTLTLDGASEQYRYEGTLDEFESEHRAMQSAVAMKRMEPIQSPYGDALQSFACAEELAWVCQQEQF